MGIFVEPALSVDQHTHVRIEITRATPIAMAVNIQRVNTDLKNQVF
jgi:hypothetical protein